MTSVKGLGASLGVAIGSSFVYENEIDFNKKLSLNNFEINFNGLSIGFLIYYLLISFNIINK